jgi:drug/metabolite transporter (DMT)-like permease
VLIGWLWLSERPTWLTLAGGVLTVAGVVLVNARRRTVPVPAQAVALKH